MRNLRQRAARQVGQATIRIGNKTESLYIAKYTYRCAVCLGALDYHGAGLRCEGDPAHRGFVTKSEAARQAEERAVQLAQVESVYEIIDGKIVYKGA